MNTFKSLNFDGNGLVGSYTVPAGTSTIIFSINFVPDTTSNPTSLLLNNKLKIDLAASSEAANGNVKCRYVLESGQSLSVNVEGTTYGTINLVEISPTVITNTIIGSAPVGTKTETFAQNFREKYLLYSPYALVNNTTFDNIFQQIRNAETYRGTQAIDPISLSDIAGSADYHLTYSAHSYIALAQAFAAYGISPLTIPETSSNYPLFIINENAPYFLALTRWTMYKISFNSYWPTAYNTAVSNNHVFDSIESLLSSNSVNNGQIAFIKDVSLFLQQINTPYPTNNIRRYNLTGQTNSRLSLTSEDLYTDYESLFVQ